MNIALCYSGQIRNIDKCYPTHLKHLINANDSHKFFIFGHFWHDSSKQNNNYSQKTEDGKWDIKNNEYLLSINPNSVMFDKPIKIKTDIVQDPRFFYSVENAISMFFSIEMSHIICTLYSIRKKINFDWVVRLRTDLYFKEDLIFDNYNPEYCYVNDQFIHTSYAVNDMFAFSNMNNMTKYASTYSNISQLIKDKCLSVPECLLGYNLKNLEVPIAKTELQNKIFYLYRDLL